jgi:hypothetical protein
VTVLYRDFGDGWCQVFGDGWLVLGRGPRDPEFFKVVEASGSYAAVVSGSPGIPGRGQDHRNRARSTPGAGKPDRNIKDSIECN